MECRAVSNHWAVIHIHTLLICKWVMPELVSPTKGRPKQNLYYFCVVTVWGRGGWLTVDGLDVHTARAHTVAVKRSAHPLVPAETLVPGVATPATAEGNLA